MTIADIWRAKSDDEVRIAAKKLHEFTDEGKLVIRAEAIRRGIPETDFVDQSDNAPMLAKGTESKRSSILFSLRAAEDQSESEYLCRFAGLWTIALAVFGWLGLIVLGVVESIAAATILVVIDVIAGVCIWKLHSRIAAVYLEIDAIWRAVVLLLPSGMANFLEGLKSVGFGIGPSPGAILAPALLYAWISIRGAEGAFAYHRLKARGGKVEKNA